MIGDPETGSGAVRSIASQLAVAAAEKPRSTRARCGDLNADGDTTDHKFIDFIEKVKQEFVNVYTLVNEVKGQSELYEHNLKNDVSALEDTVEKLDKKTDAGLNQLENSSGDAWTRLSNDLSMVQTAGNKLNDKHEDLEARLAAFSVQLGEWKERIEKTTEEIQTITEAGFCTDRMVQTHIAAVTEQTIENLRETTQTYLDGVSTRMAKLEVMVGSATATSSSTPTASGISASEYATQAAMQVIGYSVSNLETKIQNIESVMGNNGGGGGAHGGQQSASLSGSSNCHCKHLDDAVTRIQALELAVHHGQQGVPDPWHVGAAQRPDGRGGVPGGASGGVPGGAPGAPGAPGGHGGHGPPGHGGPPGIGAVAGAAGHGHIKWSTNLFDTKLTLNEKYQWNGGDKGADAWFKTLRGFFTGACPMIKPILNWAETQDEKPISEHDLVAEYNSGSWMMEGENVVTISQHLWKFLQMTVSGTAANTFASCSDLNGVDAWRALVWDVNRGRAGRMLKMHDGVHRPAGVRAYGEVIDLINRYVTNLNDFQAAGGTLPSDIEMKQALLRAFPQDLREALLLPNNTTNVHPHLAACQSTRF